MGKLLNIVTAWLLNHVQKAISSPLYFFGVILGTGAWMLYETHFAKHPIEGAFNSWGYTVLIYTLMSLWVENAVKVGQAEQNRLQQEQLDRVEFILRYLRDQNKIVQTMLERNESQDSIMHHLVVVTNRLAEGLYNSIVGQKEDDDDTSRA